MLTFLPDFIGHPSCFQRLLERLPGYACDLVNYHRLPASHSIGEMAEELLARQDEVPAWLIGYSFGGLVGYEMAVRQPQSRLLMIDSHLPWPALLAYPATEQYQHWLTPDLREWISLMSELGEVSEQVLLRNIELFVQWQPSKRLHHSHWIRCLGDPLLDLSSTRWEEVVDRLETLAVDCTHNLALKDTQVIDFISRLVTQDSM